MWYAFGAGVHARHRVGKDVDVEEASIYIDLCRAFNKLTGIVAFPGPIPATSDHDFWGKVKNLILNGQPPDVVYVHYSWFRDAVEKQLLLDVSTYLSDIGVDINDIYEASIKQFQYRGGLYAVPRETSSIVTYFNKDLLVRNGISTPIDYFDNNNWTWDKFAEIVKELSKDGVYGCVAPVTIPYAFLPFLLSFGGQIFNESLDYCVFDSEVSLDAISYVKNLIKNEYAVLPEQAQKEDLFSKNRLGIFFSGFWEVAVLNSSELQFDWDVGHLPMGIKRVTRVASGAYGIPVSAIRQEDGLKFVSFATKPDQLIEIGKSGLIIPANKKAAESPRWLQPKLRPNNRKVFLEALNYGVPDPCVKNWPEIIELLDVGLKEIWNEKETIKEGCKKITKLINEKLQGE
jgi:multiple sugar transport system substrate-binding protein